MFLVDVLFRTRQWPSDPPNTLAGTPASLTNCETQQRRDFCRFSFFMGKMLSFHERLFKFCPNRRPQKGRIENRQRLAQKDPLGGPGTRMLPPPSAGKVAGTGLHFSGFGDFCECFTLGRKTHQKPYTEQIFEKSEFGTHYACGLGLVDLKESYKHQSTCRQRPKCPL